MNVSGHDSHLQYVSSLLARYGAQEPGEKRSEAGINHRLAIARRPNDVAIESVKHLLKNEMGSARMQYQIYARRSALAAVAEPRLEPRFIWGAA